MARQVWSCNEHKEVCRPLQFGYCAPAGADQAIMLMRIMRELFPDNALLLCDVEKAHNSMSKEAVFEALEEWPKLRPLMPYVSRILDTRPLIVYYASGRGDGVAPTARMNMVDGLIQGHVLSSPLFAVATSYALRAVREKYKADGLISAYVDDTSSNVKLLKTVSMLEDIGEELQAKAGVRLNCGKTKIDLPPARSPAQATALANVTNELLQLGVQREDICDDATRAADLARAPDAKEAGHKLLGVSMGTPEHAESLLRGLVRELGDRAKLVADMALTYPAEAMRILVLSLSKQLPHTTSHHDPIASIQRRSPLLMKTFLQSCRPSWVSCELRTRQWTRQRSCSRSRKTWQRCRRRAVALVCYHWLQQPRWALHACVRRRWHSATWQSGSARQSWGRCRRRSLQRLPTSRRASGSGLNTCVQRMIAWWPQLARQCRSLKWCV